MRFPVATFTPPGVSIAGSTDNLSSVLSGALMANVDLDLDAAY